MTSHSDPVLLWSLIAALDLCGWLGGWRLLWNRHNPPPWTAAIELRRFAALGVGLLLVGAAAGWWVVGSRFAVLRLWHHALFAVLAPLSLLRSVALWRSPKRGAAVLAPVLGAGGVAMLGVVVWASAIEPFRLEVSRYVVDSPRLAGLTRPVKVVIVADVQTDHVGAWEREVFDAIDAERADLILLAGDYLQVESAVEFARERPKLVELFGRLEHRPRLGVFGVDGDIDYAPRTLDGTGARTLEDEIVRLDGEPLQVIGLSCDSSRRLLSATVRSAIERYPGYSLVLGHAPEFMLDAIEERARPDALMIAGHTHGGQVVIPGFGPPMTLSSVPRRYAAGGLFSCGATRLCISRGIGMERGHAPRVRLFCPPELVVIELR